ncbi:MAG: YicC family protein [Bacteroidetes bacterium]|nr:MAG: YicC family protein [Bacteroidota bacterium]TAF92005.1 MAG: YicC family protein [Bacteroidota bacterium]
MLYSMTGFGRAEKTIGDKQWMVDVKSLNGKQMDIRLALPNYVKPFEIEVRNTITQKLERGSAECSIYLKQNAAKPIAINQELIQAYVDQLKPISEKMGIGLEGIIAATLKMPDVVGQATDVMTDEEWHQLQQVLQQALDTLFIHRKKEGGGIETDLLGRIASIETNHHKIVPLALLRKEKLRDGFKKILETQLGSENYDTNRLEQELIFYIEKMDISEEQQRLTTHLQYFREVLASKEVSKGKKLSFILQEIGREINTTGSKAYDADIQKLVVEMKDELEKAKEQILNVL